MSKKTFALTLALLFLFCMKSALAQDLLVTTGLDSVNCKIEGKRGEFTLYKMVENNKIITKAIKQDHILLIKQNYFYTSDEPLLVKEKTNKKKLRTSISFGVNKTVLTKFQEEIGVKEYDDYIKKLTSSTTIQLELQQELSDRLGLSLRYDYYSASAREKNMPVRINYTNYLLDFKDDLILHTFSPSLLYYKPLFKNKIKSTVSMGVDYTFYRNPYSIDFESYEVNAGNLGASLGAMIEYKLDKNISLGLNGRYRFGNIEKIEFTTSSNTREVELNGLEQINISRYSFGVCIIFH
jgi:hypothetical protein